MRKKKHPEHVNHERWLVSYADFITLLFAFFTTLYAISTVDQKKAGKLQYSMMTAFNTEFYPSTSAASGIPSSAAVAPIVESMLSARFAHDGARKHGIGALASKLERLSSSKSMQSRVSFKADGKGVVISLSEAGFFDSGTAELRPEAISAVMEVAEAIASEADELDVSVEGHTDNVPMRGGQHASNWALSTARATSVLGLLLSRKMLDPAHVSAAGYAEFRPVASNATAEGRARNRRVDIVARPRPPQASADSKPNEDRNER